MKYVIVTMTYSNKMDYPYPYNAQEVERNKKGPIIYEGAFSRGELIEECLLCLRDDLADKYEGMSNGKMRIVNQEDANLWLSQNKQEQDKPEEQITDMDRVLAVQVKLSAGISLSSDDMQSLDPDFSTKGINRKKKTVQEFYA